LIIATPLGTEPAELVAIDRLRQQPLCRGHEEAKGRATENG
jgi:hypothetical protein